MRKQIYVFLDILLILGALLSIATIGGGKWFVDGLAKYLPIDAQWGDIHMLQTAYDTTQTTPSMNAIHATSICPGVSADGISTGDGKNPVMVMNADARTIQGSHAGQTLECK